MFSRHRFPSPTCVRWLLSALLIAVSLQAHSQQRADCEKQYQPSTGQPGKDVVWVPTSAALAERMLDMVRLRPNDYLIDLGSGDGITVITAAKRGARAHGIEYNPDLVALAKRNAEQAGVADPTHYR